jgi:hypothetical protein
MTKAKKKAAPRKKALRVLYVEIFEEDEAAAVDAVAVAAAKATGRPVNTSEVTRQLYLDAHKAKTAVVVRE